MAFATVRSAHYRHSRIINIHIMDAAGFRPLRAAFAACGSGSEILAAVPCGQSSHTETEPNKKAAELVNELGGG